jgi:hypothetical protein
MISLALTDNKSQSLEQHRTYILTTNNNQSSCRTRLHVDYGDGIEDPNFWTGDNVELHHTVHLNLPVRRGNDNFACCVCRIIVLGMGDICALIN